MRAVVTDVQDAARLKVRKGMIDLVTVVHSSYLMHYCVRRDQLPVRYRPSVLALAKDFHGSPGALVL